MLTSFVSILFAYFSGSILTALLVQRLLGLTDPRKAGSGNPGTTNMLRISGKKAAILTLLGDLLKGAIPVILAKYLDIPPLALGCVALATLLGHSFPIFFSCKGGKGIATSFGALLTLSPMSGLILLAIFIAILSTFRYVSLASLIASALAPIVIFWQMSLTVAIPIIVMSLIIIMRHKANIIRLKQHKEPKIKSFT